MHPFLRLLCLLSITTSLTGCAPALALIGYHSSVVQLVAQVERVKLGVDGASYVASSKTTTDHALSGIVGKDCKVFNIVTTDPVCKDNTVATK